ncbi:DUF2946 domain-containing protein [Achromobacter spanius]|uniref:DUF2946 domain-containing protein n=1 Tax=Achromobacter spanius TaxID=217203 RepID=A0A2S5GJV6_9BURK|nr:MULTISPECIES: DUF2946 family protein [Achromobacter]AYD66334.1 DUF2946 domain-containing protein [Achromobacter sp. B7]PPA73153.1 DUF2946 domain-containing protein [Achromobacter spanius]QYJ20574.1 DUF2946 family protein [Achromobacter sp. ES-001]
MSEMSRLLRFSGATRARVVLWLALLALTLRALVPTGYMPDTRALHEGRFEVTFCSAAGELSTLDLKLESPRNDGSARHDATETGAQCPFGLLAHVAPAPTPTVSPIVVPTGRPAPPAIAYRALPPLAAHGPPLGSRAPPSLV